MQERDKEGLPFFLGSPSFYSSASNSNPNCEADSFTLLTMGELSVRGFAGFGRCAYSLEN